MNPVKNTSLVSPNSSVADYIADSPILHPQPFIDCGVNQNVLQEFWKIWNSKERSLVLVPPLFFSYKEPFTAHLSKSPSYSKPIASEKEEDAFSCPCGCGGNNNCCAYNQTKTVVPKKYICTYPGCQYSTIRRSDMTIHIRTHTGEKPFKCPYDNCDYAAVTKSILAIHLRTHTGEKPLKCPYPNCGYSSANHSNLKVHLRKHTGEKPFRCTFPNCVYASITSSDLKKHMRTHDKLKQSFAVC